MKLFFLFLILIGVVNGCKTSSSPAVQQLSKFSENRALLKQYAFCKCLTRLRRDSTQIFSDDPSRGVLWELSSYSEDVYASVDSFTFRTTDTIKPSQIADHGGSKLPFVSCFEFYHSGQLDSLIKSFDHKIIRWSNN